MSPAPPSWAIALVTSIYFLVNAAVLHVLPIGVLAHSSLAVADAAKLVIRARPRSIASRPWR